MPSSAQIVNTEELLDDLRRSISYASRAGLLRDRELSTLEAIEAEIRDQHPADPRKLLVALNQVAAIIAPITVADLRAGRDPFDPANQTKARLMQMALAGIALLVLVLIGAYMSVLQSEQQIVREIADISELHPEQKILTLRKLARWDEPIARPSVVYDDYHARIAELRDLSDRMTHAVAAAEAANKYTVWLPVDAQTPTNDELPRHYLKPTPPPVEASTVELGHPVGAS